MNTEQYLKFHESLCNEARKLSERKNHDYADPETKEGDPLAVFSNFTQCEKQGICSTETGMLVRLTDKFSRLKNLLDPQHQQAVKDENVEDTAKDIINYICLLMGYRKAKKEVEVFCE